nr:uncharacterized protein LOC127335612 [Lolium perenne]
MGVSSDADAKRSIMLLTLFLAARVNPAIHVDPTSFPDAPPTSRFFGPHASQQHRISSRGDAGSPLAATPAAPLPRKQKVTAPATPTSAPCAAASASAAAVDSVPAASEPDAAAASAPGALAAEVPADVGSFARPSSRTWRLQTSRSPDGWSGRMRSICSSASYSLHLPRTHDRVHFILCEKSGARNSAGWKCIGDSFST